MIQWQKKSINGNNPEKVSSMQKTKPQATNKRADKLYADMTIYAIGPATLVPTQTS